MSFDADEEILQDFLVEAGEILESLSEQLVELEQRPEDPDLLNSIFRGFHTVKGGAGFLQLTPLVDCCHIAENVFDVLRKRERPVTSALMDIVLQALDTVNVMFDQVRAGSMPDPASPELLADLERMTLPDTGEDESATEPEAPVQPEAPAETPQATSSPGGDPEAIVAGGDITDDEFEHLLDALQQGGSAAPAEVKKEAASSTASTGGADDEITDDEFEKLLDELHGEGQFKVEAADVPAAPSKPSASKPATSGADGDEITDDEFEKLLDNLHGEGRFDGAVAEKFDQDQVKQVADVPPVDDSAAAKKAAPVAPKAASAATPAPKVEAKSAAAAPAPAQPAVGGDPKAALAQEATVRVDTKRLDDIMNMVGELVLVRNRLVRLGEAQGDEEMQKAVANLDVVTTDLQNSVMKTRMQPIKKVFGRFPRVVRDLARSLKKEINLELIGEDTDLDKNLVEALADPLVHLVRNSVDHGIEAPDVRVAAGKTKVGKITLSAEQEGDHILLSIHDDGGGMDPNRLRGIAVERGVMDQDAADRLSDKEAFNLIFAPGFSTKKEISDVSGRGVGMDVVKTKIAQLNGSIDIESHMGKGTSIRIKVPLTLAIMPTLMVMLGEQAFALPLVNVDEIFHLDLTKTNVVDGKEVVVVRGRPLPLFYLKRWLIKGSVQHGKESGHVVVVSVGTQQVGFVVDQLVGQEEVVIKPLGKTLNGTAGMAGATITGDGRIALILDVPSMLNHYA
ncbi:MAG: chemotaxis protein CheA [Natronospirillum sp.]